MRTSPISSRQYQFKMYIHDLGDYIGDWIFDNKLFFEMSWLDKPYMSRSLLRAEISSAFDIGANIASRTLFFEHCLDVKNVYGMKPVFANFDLFLRNTEKSCCLEVACSSACEELIIQTDSTNIRRNCKILEEQYFNDSKLENISRKQFRRLLDRYGFRVGGEGMQSLEAVTADSLIKFTLIS